MQRVQLDSVNPRPLTNKELVHYATLYAAAELPTAWVEELVKRLAEIADGKKK